MTLKPSSWLVKWAYVCEDPPSRTTVCALAWRVVVWTPAKLALATALGYIVCRQLWFRPLEITIGVAAVVGVYVLGLAFYLLLIDDRQSILWVAYRAIKDRYCPLVWIND